MKLPKKAAPILFAFFLTMVMVLVVTGVTTLLNVGVPPDFLGRWLAAWLIAWAVAFPTAIVWAPWARKIVARLTQA
jgi:hypothetical protein